jgi:hypothetical protein
MTGLSRLAAVRPRQELNLVDQTRHHLKRPHNVAPNVALHLIKLLLATPLRHVDAIALARVIRMLAHTSLCSAQCSFAHCLLQ